MIDTTLVTDWIANNLAIAAPVAAWLGSWVLYGVLGKQFLGADDDYWPRLRRTIWPVLHRLGMRSRLYAEARQADAEFVGTVAISEEEIERTLEAAGYTRNPLAALKTSPQGLESDGSWARRYGRIRGLGNWLRQLPIPLLGRMLQAAGDITALRQVHITIYTVTRDGREYVHVYAHDEPNSLNPLTALAHYKATSWSAERGVDKARDDLRAQGVDI